MSHSDEPNQPWINPVKARLGQGLPVLGITLTTNSVETAVQAAGMGFDFLWAEMEHSPLSLETLRNIVLATRGLKALPFARVPVNELWTAKRVLDAGVLGVMFPFTSTPELARQAVAACRYPPLGKRGSGAGLASVRWQDPGGYHDFADANVLVVAIIEELSAVERIDEIAAVPGIDVLFVGPSDLSFSMGLRGDMGHPKVEEAMLKVVAAAKRHGKVTGRMTPGGADLGRALDQGFLFLQCPTELNLMAAGARQFLELAGRSLDAGVATSYVAGGPTVRPTIPKRQVRKRRASGIDSIPAQTQLGTSS